mgnify:CR=1 FL=1
MSAITALTAQNTTGVTAIFDTTPQFLAQQLRCRVHRHLPGCGEDRHGILCPAHRHHRRAAALLRRKAHCGGPCDGGHLRRKAAAGRCCAGTDRKLLPLAEVLTPNIPEAEILSGMSIANAADMEAAARTISERYAAPCCARAATRSTMPTICCGRAAPASGSRASASQTPTPTAPAAPCPAPSPPICQRL